MITIGNSTAGDIDSNPHVYSDSLTLSGASIVVEGLDVGNNTTTLISSTGNTIQEDGSTPHVTAGTAFVNGNLSIGGTTTSIKQVEGDLDFITGSEFTINLNGAANAGVDFDQLQLSGTPTLFLNNATLVASVGGAYSPNGEEIIIIDVAGINAVSGTFDGLAEGSTISISGFNFTITYVGGDGNDVVLNAEDLTAPVPDVASLPDVIAECEVTSLTAPTATDNSAGTVTATGDATLPIIDQGTTVITWTYDDGNGNTSTQTQNVIITDLTAPVPDLINLTDVTDVCEVTSLVAPTATDNCAGSVAGTSDAVFPITANTTVTWTYDDSNGNTSTQMQNVVITGVDVTTTLAANNVTISANNTSGSYQWIDCADNSLINGETDIDYTPTVNGDYAVIVTEGNCSDTSACVTVSSVGIEVININNEIVLYPNPTVDGNFNVMFEGGVIKSIQVVDMLGRVMPVFTRCDQWNCKWIQFSSW